MTTSPVLDFKFAALPQDPPGHSAALGHPLGLVRDRTPKPVRNPNLRGLQCLRCDALYPVTLTHDGCPACRREGIHVALRASYLPDSAELMPMPYTSSFALGEGQTPLQDMPELASQFGVARLAIKDESCNPTGSHKDRMTAVGVAQALDFDAHTLVLASSGNAGGRSVLMLRHMLPGYECGG